MKKIFVSGCYDILHAGHLQFFRDARALGDHLTVSFASTQVLWNHKNRTSSLPDDHKAAVLASLRYVDEVVVGEDVELGLDFKSHFLRIRPDCLVVTEDDHYSEVKRQLCIETGASYVVLPKTPPEFPPISTSEIVRHIRAPEQAPLRVDFAGGWLDVPRYSRKGAFIVNCAISPLVALSHWPYERNSGLGGSGAWAILNGDEGVEKELNLGVGWQDPAVISEGGLCVWRSGPQPRLAFKTDGEMLRGRMALRWTGQSHDTPGEVDNRRDYELIEKAGALCARAVHDGNFGLLVEAVRMSHAAQGDEGMSQLPSFGMEAAAKYCGGGWGGYALYLFERESDRDLFCQIPNHRAIEPFSRY